MTTTPISSRSLGVTPPSVMRQPRQLASRASSVANTFTPARQSLVSADGSHRRAYNMSQATPNLSASLDHSTEWFNKNFGVRMEANPTAMTSDVGCSIVTDQNGRIQAAIDEINAIANDTDQLRELAAGINRYGIAFPKLSETARNGLEEVIRIGESRIGNSQKLLSNENIKNTDLNQAVLRLQQAVYDSSSSRNPSLRFSPGLSLIEQKVQQFKKDHGAVDFHTDAHTVVSTFARTGMDYIPQQYRYIASDPQNNTLQHFSSTAGFDKDIHIKRAPDRSLTIFLGNDTGNQAVYHRTPPETQSNPRALAIWRSA